MAMATATCGGITQYDWSMPASDYEFFVVLAGKCLGWLRGKIEENQLYSYWITLTISYI